MIRTIFYHFNHKNKILISIAFSYRAFDLKRPIFAVGSWTARILGIWFTATNGSFWKTIITNKVRHTGGKRLINFYKVKKLQVLYRGLCRNGPPIGPYILYIILYNIYIQGDNFQNKIVTARKQNQNCPVRDLFYEYFANKKKFTIFHVPKLSKSDKFVYY